MQLWGNASLKCNLEDPWDKDINLNSHLLFAMAMEDSGHLGADNDDAMMVEEDSGPVEDAGEWPVVEFI